MNPYVFKIGEFGIKYYSLFIMIGVILVTLFMIKEAKKFGIKKDFIINLIFWACIFGFIGARLYFVAFQWDYYSTHLSEIYKVWNGGLAIHGGILFGTLAIIIYCKKYKVSPLLMLDIAVPYLLIAQALGRWGNFFNGEAYGPATTLGHLKNLFIPDFVINGMLIDGVYHIPTFYYESIWCILGAIVILIVRRLKYVKIGQQCGLYLMWYSLGRFFIESLRTDSLMLGNFKVAQIVSVILFLVGFFIIIFQTRKPQLEGLYNNKEKVKVVNF